jgi:UDP-N-acetylmuramate dehydrogenase
MRRDWREVISREIRCELRWDEPMSSHTSFGIGGPADMLAIPSSEEDVIKIVSLARDMDVPVLAIGAGTNVLVRDKGIRGLVIKLSGGMKGFRICGDAVLAEAGSGLPEILSACAEEGLGGLEFAIGIPGTVGGAVVMNAGAWGYCIGDLVDRVRISSLEGDIMEFGREDMEFGYRWSRMPSEGIITWVKLLLRPSDPEDIKEAMRGFLEMRRSSQPVGMRSAGSVFKNPDDSTKAGYLIEMAGLKGEVCGGAMISERHANFIVNLGSASADDVLRLIEMARERVLSCFGIGLELELKVVGE